MLLAESTRLLSLVLNRWLLACTTNDTRDRKHGDAVGAWSSNKHSPCLSIGCSNRKYSIQFSRLSLHTQSKPCCERSNGASSGILLTTDVDTFRFHAQSKHLPHLTYWSESCTF